MVRTRFVPEIAQKMRHSRKIYTSSATQTSCTTQRKTAIYTTIKSFAQMLA